MDSSPVDQRVIFVDGVSFLLPKEMIGRHGAVSLEQLKRVAKNMQVHILITGETGTGKESLARHIRDVAEISAGLWGSVNCASLTADLADSELFGHVSGAFTGADDDRAGILKANVGGAVFLDEIGALPASTQRKLLRFLDSYELRPVGADRDLTVRTRIVAATNANMDDALVHDLPPRFAFQITLPPLRHRLGDIPWLLSDSRFLGDGRTFTGITWRTLCSLLVQEYPKNMRDLYNLCFAWVHGCPSNVHVLDDFSIMGVETAAWSRFAGFALAAIELRGECLGPNDMKRNGALEMCTLLLGMMGDGGGDEGPLTIKISDLPALVDDRSQLFCIHILHDAICKECDDLCRHENWPLCPATGPLQLSTLGEAVGWIINCFAAYKTLDEKKLSELAAHHDMLSLRRRPKEPSPAFLERLRGSIRNAWRWNKPGPPEVSELERILDEKGIEGELRKVCFYCADGLSNRQIANKPDITKSVSWIQENLQGLRSDGRLVYLLPVAGPGRRGNG